ncbi:hypothetical protein A5675_25455 [Mycobacterium malmoense]|nr:hypothetical protein A5675_25455 [Mycobacterium malmoense]
MKQGELGGPALKALPGSDEDGYGAPAFVSADVAVASIGVKTSTAAQAKSLVAARACRLLTIPHCS